MARPLESPAFAYLFPLPNPFVLDAVFRPDDNQETDTETAIALGLGNDALIRQTANASLRTRYHSLFTPDALRDAWGFLRRQPISWSFQSLVIEHESRDKYGIRFKFTVRDVAARTYRGQPKEENTIDLEILVHVTANVGSNERADAVLCNIRSTYFDATDHQERAFRETYDSIYGVSPATRHAAHFDEGLQRILNNVKNPRLRPCIAQFFRSEVYRMMHARVDIPLTEEIREILEAETEPDDTDMFAIGAVKASVTEEQLRDYFFSSDQRRAARRRRQL